MEKLPFQLCTFFNIEAHKPPEKCYYIDQSTVSTLLITFFQKIMDLTSIWPLSWSSLPYVIVLEEKT